MGHLRVLSEPCHKSTSVAMTATIHNKKRKRPGKMSPPNETKGSSTVERMRMLPVFRLPHTPQYIREAHFSQLSVLLEPLDQPVF